MNYNAEMLESKIFNFLKQLIRNMILSICVVVLVALLIVHFFNFAIYDVFSDSMVPEFETGDLIVVKKQKEYYVGNVVKFNDLETGLPITHRIVAIKNKSGVEYYVCHGDNVESVTSRIKKDGAYCLNWEEDSTNIRLLSLEEIVYYADDVVQIVKKEQIEGRVVGKFRRISNYLQFIKRYKIIIIASVLCVWKCVDFVENSSDKKYKFIKNNRV